MPLASVLSQHAEEAAFLWILRDRAAARPRIDRKALGTLDARLEAHLDGLRIAGPAGWDVCREVVPLEDAGAAFALASVAFDLGRDDDGLAAGLKDPAFFRGLVSAIAWLPTAKSEPLIGKLLASPDATRRRAAVGASAVLRRDPGKPLLEAASDPDPLLRARALRALGELGKADHVELCRRALGEKDPAVKLAGAWSAALLAGEAVDVLRSGGPEEADLAVRRMGVAEAAAWAAKQPPRLSLSLLGALGDPAAVPALLERMSDVELARGAGEAFEFITGFDLNRDDLWAPKPEGFESGPTDDPKDADVAPDPDDDLPWPDVAKVKARWEKAKGSFAPGKRYLLGKEISEASATEAFEKGRQRHRRAAALELAIRKKGAPLPNAAAPSLRP